MRKDEEKNGNLYVQKKSSKLIKSITKRKQKKKQKKKTNKQTNKHKIKMEVSIKINTWQGKRNQKLFKMYPEDQRNHPKAFIINHHTKGKGSKE